MSSSKILIAVAIVCMLAFAAAAPHKSHHAAAPLQHAAKKQIAEKYSVANIPHLDLPIAIAGSDESPAVPSGAPYNVTDAYVLGLSSGGFLAVQFMVAYSSEFTGAAIYAAGPYYCAQGSLSTALESCVEALMPLDLQQLDQDTTYLESLGLIDQLSNLTNAPIWLFHGQSDRTVFSTVNQALYEQLSGWGANVQYDNSTQANHAWISPLGVDPCTESQSPYISNCNNIDYQRELLTHMLQKSPKAQTSTPQGNTYSFSQDQYSEALFNVPASTYSLDTTGYIYMPTQCAKGTPCSVFVVLHGCLQSVSEIGSQLIQQSNLNTYADTNNFIIVYPQTIASLLGGNQEACWDWWGYSTSSSSSLYATHGAPQMEIIRSVIKALGFKGKPTSGTWSNMTLV